MKFILEKIRHKCFKFIWIGNKIKEGLHSLRWERLARTKGLRGWGLKDIFSFSRELLDKILWRCLNKVGL